MPNVAVVTVEVAEGASTVAEEAFTEGVEVSMAEVEVSTAGEATTVIAVDVITAVIEAVETTVGAVATVAGAVATVVGVVAMVAGVAEVGAIRGTDGVSALGGRMGGGTRMDTATALGGMIPTLTMTRITVLPATHALIMATMILHRQTPAQGQAPTIPGREAPQTTRRAMSGVPQQAAEYCPLTG